MEILCKIRDIQRAVYQFELNFENQYGICLNEGMALCTLFSTKELSSGELGKLLGLSASNTSKVIRSIESKGLVERVIGSEDKRQMYFFISPKGCALLSEIKSAEIQLPLLIRQLTDK
ncbi:MAG: MarR family transcriptional regulator [Bacteroidales bacterium]